MTVMWLHGNNSNDELTAQSPLIRRNVQMEIHHAWSNKLQFRRNIFESEWLFVGGIMTVSHTLHVSHNTGRCSRVGLKKNMKTKYALIFIFLSMSDIVNSTYGYNSSNKVFRWICKAFWEPSNQFKCIRCDGALLHCLQIDFPRISIESVHISDLFVSVQTENSIHVGASMSQIWAIPNIPLFVLDSFHTSPVCANSILWAKWQFRQSVEIHQHLRIESN